MNSAEELASCPYNACHRIQKKRFAAHLYKCKLQHPHIKLAICDFNSTHHMPEDELNYHHEHCPSRTSIEALIYKEEGESSNQYSIQNIIVDTDETWDKFNVQTYNAEEKCLKRGVLRKLDVAPPSKKKEFRDQERERIKNVENPICDTIETVIMDKNVIKENEARREKRIAALRDLIKRRHRTQNNVANLKIYDNYTENSRNEEPQMQEFERLKIVENGICDVISQNEGVNAENEQAKHAAKIVALKELIKRRK
ncbi:unnamed protein product [Acanthoscelides obtectus]|uniref:CHHC U11-48K-type domain-containing protein n=1 Tax=Acanthoscelides obtectus TaxID=200917 RepID=A0A9P0M570_ACAOB|nr:unnamed protein product [Acanthoscelides obtectus]CAK1664130.1 Gametocyte-specific factor 1 homolog [Acanthoscelides obtectus]